MGALSSGPLLRIYGLSLTIHIQVLARCEGVPLVLARVASASFTLKGVSPNCAVGAAAGDLAGVSQEPEEDMEAWEEVQCLDPSSWLSCTALCAHTCYIR